MSAGRVRRAAHGFFNPQVAGGKWHRETLLEADRFLARLGYLSIVRIEDHRSDEYVLMAEAGMTWPGIPRQPDAKIIR